MIVKVKPKEVTFEAIRLRSEKSEAISRWSDDELVRCNPEDFVVANQGSSYLAEAGQWAIKYSDRQFIILSDEEFRETFEVIK